MLTLPDFLREFVRKARNVKDKFGAVLSDGSDDNGVDRLTKFENNMEKLEDMLHNPKEAEFIVVTIPTVVAMEETRRLLTSLQESSIFLRRVIVNQMISGLDDSDETKHIQAQKYMDNLRTNQEKSLSELHDLSKKLSVHLIKIPFFEYEVRSTYGLKFIGNLLFKDSDTSSTDT